MVLLSMNATLSVVSTIEGFVFSPCFVMCPFLCCNHLAEDGRAGLKIIKLFSCSTQLSMTFILLINVKMPTIVGSMINTAPEFEIKNNLDFSTIKF